MKQKTFYSNHNMKYKKHDRPHSSELPWYSKREMKEMLEKWERISIMAEQIIKTNRLSLK